MAQATLRDVYQRVGFVRRRTADARVVVMPTIGVAVAIPEPWATQLQDYRTAVGDATATMIPTHITLVPPTEVADDLAVDRGAPGRSAPRR